MLRRFVMLGFALAEAGCTSTLRVEQPTAITVGQARRVPVSASVTYDDFWTALADMDVHAAQSIATNADERRLAEALGNMLGGETRAADDILRDIHQSASDTMVRRVARVSYGALLHYEADWDRLSRLRDAGIRGVITVRDSIVRDTSVRNAGARDSTLRSAIAVDSVRRDEAGVEAWAVALRGVRAQRYDFPDGAVVLPLTVSGTGVPTVPVSVNGHVYQFWIDTGSSFTVVGSDIAAACGVLPLEHDVLEAQAAVSRVAASPAVVDSLRLGGLTMRNVPAMIIRSAQLQVASRRAIDGIAHGAVDGIIGFDVIKHLDMELDYTRGHVTIRAPSTPGEGATRRRNLFWFGVPIVELSTDIGMKAHMLLDTGADETYATLALLDKIFERPSVAERREINGFGQSVMARGVVLPRVQLYLDRTPIVLKRTFLYSARYPTIFTLDGTIGSDIARSGVVRIDMTNGRFEVTPEH